MTAVESLELTVHDSTSITLSWMPPFTLDIEDIHPDIDGYCVDIVDSVSMTTLYSECGLNMTEFSYPIPPENGCRLYINTITPVNTVGNGTRSAVFYRGTTGGELYTCNAYSIVWMVACYLTLWVGPHFSGNLLHFSGV